MLAAGPNHRHREVPVVDLQPVPLRQRRGAGGFRVVGRGRRRTRRRLFWEFCLRKLQALLQVGFGLVLALAQGLVEPPTSLKEFVS